MWRFLWDWDHSLVPNVPEGNVVKKTESSLLYRVEWVVDVVVVVVGNGNFIRSERVVHKQYSDTDLHL